MDTLHVAVSNFPPGDPLWIKVGLPILGIVGTLVAGVVGALIGGRLARKAAIESQRVFFEEEARRRLTPAIKATKRHLDGVATIAETLGKSPPDLEISPTLLLALRSIAALFNETAPALGLLGDEKLENDILDYFENVEMNCNSIERGDRVFKENLSLIETDPLGRNLPAIELLQQRNQRQEWIKGIAGWKPQAGALLVRLKKAEESLKPK